MSIPTDATPLQRELHAAHLARRAIYFPSPVKPVEIAQPRFEKRIRLKRVPVELTRPIEQRPIPNRPHWARSPNAVHRIIAACAAHYRVTVDEILSDRIWNPIVRPRQISMYLAKNLTPHSLPMLGGIFRRDHTTVLFGVRKIERLIPTDTQLRADVETIKKALAG